VSDAALPARRDGPDLELIGALGREIDRVLAPLVPRDSPLALIGAPTHPNVGDSLIWLGQLAYLRRRGAALAYTCNRFTYSARALRRRVGAAGTVLISGGGNFGDLWPEQALRERAALELPAHRIVQLSQSIHFRSDDQLGRAVRVLREHRDLHVLCRDGRSLELARAWFADRAAPCPDLSFALGALTPPADSEIDVLVLARADHERVGDRLTAPDYRAAVADWARPVPGESGPGTRSRALHALLAGASRTSRALAPAEPMQRLHERYSRERARAGARLLARGRVVITDRLHGHILALLLGLPHVLVDTAHGKLEGFHDSWTRGSRTTHAAGSAAEATRIAERLLAGGDADQDG
jgi:exopolysaccharide biosynthesis predicted pyruvyltransferase EpsI